jgi:hypothetical protein
MKLDVSIVDSPTDRFRDRSSNWFREAIMINGQDLIAWGYQPGRWFHQAIMRAERARRDGASEEEIRAIVSRLAPNDLDNTTAPTLESGSPLPPAGSEGTGRASQE